MTYTLNDYDLGDVQSELHAQSADIQPMAMPASRSSATLAFDFMGVIRRITVKARRVFTTKESMMNFVENIEAILSGAQTGVTYHSDRYDHQTSGDYTDGNFNVYVTGFTPNITVGEEFIVTYSLNLLEAT